MSHLARQFWALALFAVVTAGCKPLDSLLDRNEVAAEDVPTIAGEPTGTSNPDTPSVPPPPPPSGEPTPPPPAPAPTTLSVVVGATTLVMDEGSSGALTTRLSMDPGKEVTVAVAFKAADPSISLTGDASVTFDASNWNTDQTFQFSAAQDADSTDGFAILDVTLDGARSAQVFLVATDDEVAQNDGVRITVKDSSDHGFVDYPIVAVIPLAYGTFQDVANFSIRDGNNDAIPAQFHALNRWTARDNSIRHVVAQFQASGVPKGATDVFFKTDGSANAAPAKPVSVDEQGNVVTVDTGVVRFSILKTGFNLFNEVHVSTLR